MSTRRTQQAQSNQNYMFVVTFLISFPWRYIYI